MYMIIMNRIRKTEIVYKNFIFIETCHSLNLRAYRESSSQSSKFDIEIRQSIYIDGWLKTKIETQK